MSSRWPNSSSFTYAKQNNAKLKFLEPTEVSLEADDKKIVTLRFLLPLETPVSAQKPFSFQVYDPTYFVSFDFEKQNPVTLAKAPAGCSVSARRAEAARRRRKSRS